jgi:carboxyl-terminal processing protease
VADLQAYLPQLKQMHDARVAISPSWKLMLDELSQYRTMRAKTSISLNFATREAERKQQEKIQADFRARHKAIDGTDTALADAESTLDDGLNANERSLKSELKQEKDAKKAKDVELDETAHILFDAIGMIKSDPKLAREVLPYGGKFSPKAMAAIQPAADPAALPAAVPGVH